MILFRRLLSVLVVSCVVLPSMLMAASSTPPPAIRMPSEGWSVNNFRQPDTGAETTLETAPDGSTAIRARFFGTKSSNLVMPSAAVPVQAGQWPETFTGLKGFLWNDGTLSIVNLVLRTGNGQDEPFSQWNARLVLDHSGWQVVAIPTLVNYQDRFKPLAPRAIRSVFINASGTAGEVAFGALYWEPEGAVLRQRELGKAAVVVRTAEPPQIDGRLDEAVWQSQPAHAMDAFAHERPAVYGVTNSIQVVFDDTAFYLAAVLPRPLGTPLKAELREHDAELWSEEDFEFFLFPEPDPRQHYHFLVNPLGTRADLARVFDQVADRIETKYKNWTNDWQCATSVREDVWIVEAAIPWHSIGAEAVPALLQFQAMRSDMTGDTPRYPIWSPAVRRPTEGFGVLATAETTTAPRLQGLSVRRQDQHLHLSGFAEALPAAGLYDLVIEYAPPNVAPRHIAGEIAMEGTTGFFRWTFDGGTPVSGMHQMVVKVTPRGEAGPPAVALVVYDQILPSRFAFSDLVFNPEPKQFTQHEGAFMLNPGDFIHISADATPRTRKTAEYLAGRLYGLYGLRPPVRSNGGEGALRLAVGADAIHAATQSTSEEAYRLDVTPERITITGAGEAGLYYGVVTLLQAATAAKQPKAPIPALAILDYPTYERRIVSTYEMFHVKKDSGDGGGGYDLDKLRNWLERYVAGNKYNTLFLSWGDQVNYPSVPEVHHPRNFEPEEIASLYALAREHFIDAYPGVLFGAHAPAFTRHFPELIEERFGLQQMDVTLPGVYELMGRVYNDLLDLAGPEADYFMTFNDEWWHGSKTAADGVYKGQTRQEMFYRFLMAEYELLHKRGVRMAMFTDMLHPKHNGGPPFNLTAVANRLPRDIALATWSEPNGFFAELGFETLWRIDNGFVAHSRKSWPGDTGFGRIQYGSSDLFNQTDQQRTLHYAFHTAFPAANYGWNGEEKSVEPMEEWTLQWMPSLMGVYSFCANPAAGTALTPLPLGGDNRIVGERELPERADVGGIPMALGVQTAVVDAPVTIDLAPGTHFSSAYVLNNVAPPDLATARSLHELYRKEPSARPYGLIVGVYRLLYEDGSVVEMPLRLGRSIAYLEYTPAQSRYVRECRAVYPLDAEQTLAFNQFEWVNPHPDKAVRQIEVQSRIEAAPILVAAVTLRSVE